MKLSKKYCIKIPENIKVLYNSNEDIITFIGPLGKKSLKLKLKVLVNNIEKLLYVTKEFSVNSLGSQKKKLNSLRGTVTAFIKQSLLEVSVTLYKKLELVGVGYRVFTVENNLNSILQFKLGFSHSIFFKLTCETKALCFKTTNLYLFGNSFNRVNQLASTIRSYKIPEPYKGKGVLYKNEKIKLKEGKKV